MAYSQVGYYFVIRHFQYQQKKAVKEKIISGLKEEELEVILLTDEISWKDDGKEFLYRGEMYDIVKAKTTKGKVLLYCINDKKEKALVDHYNHLTKHNSFPGKKGKNIVDNQFNLIINDIFNPVVTNTATKNHFIWYDSRLKENIILLDTPPPRMRIA